MRTILIDDCRFEGGNIGAVVGGNGPVGTKVNILIDDVTFNRLWHSTLAAPSAFGLQGNFQIGQRAQVLKARMKDCYGYGAGDVSYEVNNGDDVIVENCIAEDPYNLCFLATNFTPPASTTQGQRVTFKNCRGIKMLSVGPTRCFDIVDNSVAFGTLVLDHCSWYAEALPNVSGQDFLRIASGLVDAVIIEGARVTVRNWTYSAAGALNYYTLYLAPATAAPGMRLRVHDFEVHVSGTTAGGAGTLTHIVFYLGGRQVLDIDGVKLWHDLVVGGSACQCYGMDFLSGANIRGLIKQYEVISVTGTLGGSTRGVIVRGTATLTIPTRLIFEQCDWASLPASSSDVLFATGSENKDKVQFTNCRRFAAQNPAAVTAGASPYTYQNLSGVPESHQITGGTVSNIEVDGTTGTFTSTGATSGQFVVMPGRQLRITYSVVPTSWVRSPFW